MPNSSPSSREPGWKRLCRHLWECFKDFQGIGALWNAVKEESRGLKRGWVFFTLILCFAMPLAFCTGRSWEVRQSKRITIADQPVASVHFALVLNLPKNEENANNITHNMNSGLGIYVASGNPEKQTTIGVVLVAMVLEHVSHNHEFRWIADASYDSTAMGQPISDLAAVSEIILHFSQNVIPVGTMVGDGELVMVVNNQVTIKFRILSQTIEKVDNNNTVIVLTDVHKQMRKAIKQLSG
jgi:hypothetical protein